METIIVTADNKTEFSLVKALLERMRVGFRVVDEEREELPMLKVKYTKEEFGEMLERAGKGKKTLVTDEYIKSLLA
jgi:hypothetical protein